MRLEARVKRLENAQGVVAQDLSMYDDHADYQDHQMYFCEADGTDVFLVTGLLEDVPANWGTEQELWTHYPGGTKFYRSVKGGGNYSVVDGVMRELHFPPSDGELSPVIQAAIEDVLSTFD